jgi:hypothetical protein
MSNVQLTLDKFWAMCKIPSKCTISYTGNETQILPLISSPSSSTITQEGTACEDEHQVEGDVEVGLGFEIEGGATYEIKSGAEYKAKGGVNVEYEVEVGRGVEVEIEGDAEHEAKSDVEVEGENDAEVEVDDKLYNKSISCAHLFI